MTQVQTKEKHVVVEGRMTRNSLICGGFVVMLFTWVYCLVKGLRFMNIRKWKTSDALNELNTSNNIVVYTNNINDVPACILRPGRVGKVYRGWAI